MLDDNIILWKMVRLRYTIEPTIVMPRKLTSLIIVEFHNGKGHQGISCTVNMTRHYFWWVGICRDVHQCISNCQLCIQFLPYWLYVQPMHLEIPKVPFAGCAMDCIGPLPATSKGNRHTLMFISLLTSYLIMVLLKGKMADEVSMAYIKEILPKTSCSKFILQDNDTKFKNKQLITVFDTLGIKHIYSNPYYPQGNWRIKMSITSLSVQSQRSLRVVNSNGMMHSLRLPTAIALHHWWMTLSLHSILEGRLSNLQNYCRYIGDQPGRLVVQELQRTWKLHAKHLAEKQDYQASNQQKGH